MAVSLITFSTPSFKLSAFLLKQSALVNGIDTVLSFTEKDFKKTKFYEQNSSITKQDRGAGYWLWKPYFIYEELSKLDKEDILIYCDSAIKIVSNIKPVIAAMGQQDIMLFENYQGSSYIPTSGLAFNYENCYTEINKIKYWCKNDAFKLMDADTDDCHESYQVDASFLILRKTTNALEFVKEWLKYSAHEAILTDTPDSGKQIDHFITHRHDQSVLSILAWKNGIELFRCPSQFGNHYKLTQYRQTGEFLLLPYANEPKLNSEYGSITLHHRAKINPFTWRLKRYLKTEVSIADGLIFKGIFPAISKWVSDLRP